MSKSESQAGSPGSIDTARDGFVARVTLHNPARRNAVGYAMWQQLGDTLEALRDDTDVRVLVLRGAGEKAFSAGADIKEFDHWRSEPARAAEYSAMAKRATAALASFPAPVIADIRGVCIGGGLELALLCDIRICTEVAHFAVTPARLGLGYDLHDTQLLVDRLGAQAARELLFTARSVSVVEALRLGIVNRVSRWDDHQDNVDAYVADIIANAPLTVRASKAVIAEALKTPAARDEALCQRLVAACYASADYAEGRAAFAQKRKPEFKGR